MKPRCSATLVIGRATGGLTKVRHCAYLYDWLDISDRAGEAAAFYAQIATAIATYRSIRPVTPSSCMRRWRSMPAGRVLLGSTWTCIAMAFSQNSGIRNARSSLQTLRRN